METGICPQRAFLVGVVCVVLSRVESTRGARERDVAWQETALPRRSSTTLYRGLLGRWAGQTVRQATQSTMPRLQPCRPGTAASALSSTLTFTGTSSEPLVWCKSPPVLYTRSVFAKLKDHNFEYVYMLISRWETAFHVCMTMPLL